MADVRGLYAITPDDADDERLFAGVSAVLAGGCRLLQYRDKLSEMPCKVRRAHRLRALTRQHHAQLIINDDLALARLVGADGVHLGRDDGHLRQARAILGPDALIGASCYADFASARRAVDAGASYVAFGAVFPSPTKPGAPRAPAELFIQAARELPVPAVAIGGITLDQAAPLVAAGAAALAVISDLFQAADIALRAAEYQSLFETDRP